MRTAAFFDMDHTVLRKDTGMSWMRFLRRRGELSSPALARAVWWSLLYKAAVLDLEALATRLCADLAGEEEAEMIAKCRVWYEADVAPMVTPAARHALAAHQARGDVIVLATGATQYAALAVAEGLGIEHTLCSRLEVEAGRFTGRLAAMCFGPHKVTLAEGWAAAHGIDLARSTFYSDSYNDLPMLERVGAAVAVNPDVRLWRHARRSGWRIEHWA
ncbi:MAG: HAD family hydrolase [Kofleriaceae bacterium]|nr:HAD family hydrolase [Kofleriaceae bacterium]MCL4223820.1 HAD-IB family hydrolase [Myxococcales bacterium]